MKKTWVKLLVSLLIGVLFVWLAFRDVNWDKFMEAISNVDWLTIVLYFGVLCLIHVVRVIRWGVLLKPLGQISFGRLFSVGSVGIMALTLLPLRIGEFARPILIAERGKIRVSGALATVVVERLVDSLAMTLLLVLILFFIKTQVNVPDQIVIWGWALLGLFLLGLLFLIVAYRHPEATVNRFVRIFSFGSAKIRGRLSSILFAFIDGLKVLPNFKLLAWFLFLTVVFWTLNGLGMLLVFRAFSGLSHLGAIEAFAALAMLCVGLMIPAGPAMAGNFEYFIKLGLSLFVPGAVAESAGLAYAVLLHVMQVGQQVLFALPFLFSSHVSWSRLTSLPKGEPASPTQI